MSYRNLLGLLSPETPIMHIGRAILSAPVRHLFMIGTVWYLKEKCGRDTLSILEIGSWCGASALSWGQGIKAYCAGEGSLTCVDAWEPFFRKTEDHAADYAKDMDALLESDIAYEIFLHNLRTVPGTIKTQHFRGQSENVLMQLRDQCYDVAFIDANHAYSPVHGDILATVRLVKDGGIICGDDLNLQLHECNKAFTWQNAEKDLAIDPESGRNYHPGVTLAVAKIFGKVSAWGGFWAMQKDGNAWKPISMKGMPVVYPDHFPEEALMRARDHYQDIKHLL
jgi:predicted O-methyltransferase YrrM